VTVCFKRRLSNKTMRLYVKMVSDWLASVALQGIFGEGSIIPVAPAEVIFQNPRAQFRVDAQHSGQNTLNWFVLNALHFGIDVAAITTVVFDSEENLDQIFPPTKGKDIIKIPLELPVSTEPRVETPTELCTQAPRQEKSETNHLRLVGSDEGEEGARWPSDCSPFTEFPSDLPLFTRPYFEWDAFIVTIYFGRVPSPEEQDSFRNLIEAWGTIGSYGGWGGEGIHRLHPVTFDQEIECASFWADMGDSDEQTAFPMLLRLLERFASIVPMDAIVFGQGVK
jgi:hypothetical protein